MNFILVKFTAFEEKDLTNESSFIFESSYHCVRSTVFYCFRMPKNLLYIYKIFLKFRIKNHKSFNISNTLK